MNKTVYYYYAAVTYERKNDPVGHTTRGAFIGAANGGFPVTECIKKMHEMAEDIRPGSAVIDNVIELTKEDFEAYTEYCKQLKTKED